MANNFWKIRNLQNAIFEKVKLGGAWAPPEEEDDDEEGPWGV